MTQVNRPKRRLNRTTRQKLIFVYTALIPIVGLYLLMRIIPIGQNFFYSFFHSTIVKPANRFIGLGNYLELFSDHLFRTAIYNTTYFAFSVTLFGVLISLGIALLLAKKTKMSPLYEAIYFLPVITPMVPVSVVWKWIYDPAYGLLNYFISLFGLRPVAWLVYPNTALIAIIIMSVWKLIGYNMIIFLVGLRDIPTTYIEAARIDGANSAQVLGRITLPLLRPILLLVVVITTINSFNVFTQVYIMTSGPQGAPSGAVRTLVFDIYENAFRYYRTGYAASEAVILFLIILALTLIQFGISGATKGKGDAA